MKPATDPIWEKWIDLSNYYEFSGDNSIINKNINNGNEAYKKCVIIALSVAKWHPRNPIRGCGNCFCCEYFECTEGQNCPAIEICGPNNRDTNLYKKWFDLDDYNSKEAITLADKIYHIMLKQYRKALKEMENTKQTKHVMKRHLGKRITHADVETIPEGIELLLEEAMENPKDPESDAVLRCTLFDEEGRSYRLGDFGGVKHVFRLDKVPQIHRMAVYRLIALAADKVGAA